MGLTVWGQNFGDKIEQNDIRMARFWVQDEKCVAQGRKCNDRAQTHKIISASINIGKVEKVFSVIMTQIVTAQC